MISKIENTSLSPNSSEKYHKTSKGAKIAEKHTNAPKTLSSHTNAILNTTTKNHGPKQVWVPKKT